MRAARRLTAVPAAALIVAAALLLPAASTAADPVTFSGLSVAPQKAFLDQRGGVRIGFQVVGSVPADVLIRVVGPGGEVRKFGQLQVPPGIPKTVAWNGLTAAGAPIPDGAYRVLIGQVGAAEQLVGSANLYGHIFPVRGPHGSRGAVGMFHAPRNGGRIHEGYDILGACGTPLAAVRAGTVTRKGYDPVLYGNFIQIKGVGEKQSYFYAHMVKPSPFARRDHVQTGDIVGRIGQTGNAAGLPCHLHFQIMLGGKTPIDPLPQLTRWDKYS